MVFQLYLNIQYIINNYSYSSMKYKSVILSYQLKKENKVNNSDF